MSIAFQGHGDSLKQIPNPGRLNPTSKLYLTPLVITTPHSAVESPWLCSQLMQSVMELGRFLTNGEVVLWFEFIFILIVLGTGEDGFVEILF